LAVGAPMRCMAVPGTSSGGSSSSGGSAGSLVQAAAAAGQRNSFGVLTWEQLPGAICASAASSGGGVRGSGRGSSGSSDAALEFPAWLSQEQQQPSTVSVAPHAGTLKQRNLFLHSVQQPKPMTKHLGLRSTGVHTDCTSPARVGKSPLTLCYTWCVTWRLRAFNSDRCFKLRL
jgi:hypothetical protein